MRYAVAVHGDERHFQPFMDAVPGGDFGGGRCFAHPGGTDQGDHSGRLVDADGQRGYLQLVDDFVPPLGNMLRVGTGRFLSGFVGGRAREGAVVKRFLGAVLTPKKIGKALPEVIGLKMGLSRLGALLGRQGAGGKLAGKFALKAGLMSSGRLCCRLMWSLAWHWTRGGILW